MSDKLKRNDSPQSRQRRQILTAGSTGALALALGSRAALAEDAAAASGESVSVARDGNYERVPLRKGHGARNRGAVDHAGGARHGKSRSAR